MSIAYEKHKKKMEASCKIKNKHTTKQNMQRSFCRDTDNIWIIKIREHMRHIVTLK